LSTCTLVIITTVGINAILHQMLQLEQIICKGSTAKPSGGILKP